MSEQLRAELHAAVEASLTRAVGPFERREAVHAAIDRVLDTSGSANPEAAEARRQLLDELRGKVEGLLDEGEYEDTESSLIRRAAVLALLEGEGA